MGNHFAPASRPATPGELRADLAAEREGWAADLASLREMIADSTTTAADRAMAQATAAELEMLLKEA